MSSYKTIHELALEALGKELDAAFNDIGTSNEVRTADSGMISIDDLTRRYFSSKLDHDLSRVSVGAGEVELGIEIERIRLYGRGKGRIVLLILFIVVAILFGTAQILIPLQSLLGA